ncbi:MAG TPA: DNA polymerase III subunit delta [Holophagaceae bacterium]|nr:DNA polymerase III subunit delta [Holophagaceae bacterium]
MIPAAWVGAPFALVHGEDGDRRRAAVAAWKAAHVDPEWADFALTVCGEGCPWAEVLSALHEAPPLGAETRCVLVPAADNLFAKPKELPTNLRAYFDKPPSDLRLLFVAWASLPAGPGKALGAKPWSDWVKAGRVLKVGALETQEIPDFIESEAMRFGLRLAPRVPALLGQRLGGSAALLTRAMEVLDLLAEDRQVTEAMVDQVTFRLAEQKAFAWSGAWQRGDATGALAALRQALEDGDDPLMILGSARREVERLWRLAEAERSGVRAADLPQVLGLSPKQGFLLEGYRGVLAKHKAAGVQALLAKVNQCERDLKGLALSRSGSPLLDLTLSLARAWSR